MTNEQRAEDAKRLILSALNAQWNVSVSISPGNESFKGNLFLPGPPEQQSAGENSSGALGQD